MNKFCIALSLGLGSSLVSAEPVQPIIHAPLDAKTVFRLPVASDRITTVYFPGPISGLEAAFVTLDGEPPARFQCSFLPGQRYFSLRAIQPNSTANINVIWNGNIYVIEAFHSQDPTYAVVLSPPLRQQTPSTNGIGQPGTPAVPSGAVPLPAAPATNAAAAVVGPTGTRRRPAQAPTHASVRPRLTESAAPRMATPASAYPGPPEPVPGSTITTNRVAETLPDERKPRRWWDRWSIPYLIYFQINTSKD